MSLSLPPYEPQPWLAGRWLAIVPGGFLTAVLAVALILGLTAASAPPEGASILDGTWASTFEHRLDDAIGTRQVGLPLFGALEYLLFGSGRKGVVVGSEGWLFSSEELEQHPHEAVTLAERQALIQAVSRFLGAKGIGLRVALIPSKARIYAQKLGRLRFPAVSSARYEPFRRGLVQAGVDAPDLVAPLQAGAESAPMFLRTDTHWTPAGAKRAADALAAGLSFPERGQKPSRLELRAAELHSGDLLKFLPMGPFSALGPQPDSVTSFRAVPDAGAGAEALLGDALFGDARIPVTLIGTSYSKDTRWGFASALRVSLGAEVLDAAQEGRGPFAPMLAYLENPAFRESPPSVVIWEIPERYLAAPTELSGHEATLNRLGLGGG